MSDDEALRSLSDEEIVASYERACTTNIRWMLEDLKFDDGWMLGSGWAVSRSDDAGFFINGRPFDEVAYREESPYLIGYFPLAPFVERSRFFFKTRLGSDSFPGGHARLEFRAADADATHIARSAWYVPSPHGRLAVPSGAQITRVIGAPSATQFLIGGATLYKRIEHYLGETFCRGYDSIGRILDWGCGCGRLSRHFVSCPKGSLDGIDIDGENIAWCRENLPFGCFQQSKPLPPTRFENETFDLIVGCSVLTHLSEAHQFAWLEELRRISRRGAVVLLSVQGPSQNALYRPGADCLRRVETDGFLVTARNAALDEVVEDQSIYLDVMQSRNYIRREWGRYFQVHNIVDAIAANQDLVVLLKT
jgi:SAM-dependent methyltransferase